MMLFTSTSFSACCSFMFLSQPFMYAQSFPLHSFNFKNSSGRRRRRLRQDSRGAEAAGDMPEGMPLKHALTTKARLGSVGGERRWLLFEKPPQCLEMWSSWLGSLLSMEKEKKKKAQLGWGYVSFF